jgi:hypothetical protein
MADLTVLSDRSVACDGASTVEDAKPLPSKVAAELVPHRGHVFLDATTDGDLQLTHTVTLEKHKLGGGRPLELHFDEDGFACIVDSSAPDADPSFVEDILRYGLYQDDEGDYYVKVEHGEKAGELTNFTHFGRKYMESTISIEVGPTKAMTEFDLGVFKWPRNGARVFISMKSVYSKLGFSQFGGNSWQWIGAAKARWVKYLTQHGLAQHFEYSAQKGKGIKDSGEDAGILPFSAVSIHGLVFLLSRWSWLPERLGGLRDVDNQAAAMFLLQGIVSIVVASGPHIIEVDVSPTWINQWPRPTDFSMHITVQLRGDGMIDFSEWEEMATTFGERSFAHRSFSAFKANLQQGSTFLSFMKALATGGSLLMPIFAQLVWRTGSLYQDLCLKSFKGVAVRGMKTKELEIGDLFENRSRLDAHLVRYVESCRVTMRNRRSFTMCTDKAAVGGFNLQCSLIVLPDNTAVVPPPQVLAWLAYSTFPMYCSGVIIHPARNSNSNDIVSHLAPLVVCPASPRQCKHFSICRLHVALGPRTPECTCTPNR